VISGGFSDFEGLVSAGGICRFSWQGLGCSPTSALDNRPIGSPG